MQIIEASLKKILQCVPSMIMVITSRTTPQFLKLALKIQRVPMKGLAAEDAHELLCLVSPDISPGLAEELANECGRIPYALSLLGKGIFLNGISAEVTVHSQM